MNSPDAEQSIIHQAKAGDRLALEWLLISHSDTLSTHIAHRLPTSLQSTVSVEDVTQDAFTNAFLKIDQLRETTTSAFVAWIKAIGDTTLMDLMKAQRRKKRGGDFHKVQQQVRSGETGSFADLLNQLPEEGATASRLMACREAIAALQVGISGLPDDQRQAIQLHLLQGKTLEQTGAEMNRSPTAIRGLVHRGKQKLAEAMGRASLWLSRS